MRAIEAREKLRQTSPLESRCRFEDRVHHARRFALEAITNEARCVQRVVEWPNRSELVRKRIVRRVRGRKRAHTPAAPEVRLSEPSSHRARPLRARQTAPQEMSRV